MAALVQGWREQKQGTEFKMAVGINGDRLVNQLNFIPACKEHVGLGSPGTNPNLHEVAHFYHTAGLVEARWPYLNDWSSCLVTMGVMRGRASAGDCIKGHR